MQQSGVLFNCAIRYPFARVGLLGFFEFNQYQIRSYDSTIGALSVLLWDFRNLAIMGPMGSPKVGMSCFMRVEIRNSVCTGSILILALNISHWFFDLHFFYKLECQRPANQLALVIRRWQTGQPADQLANQLINWTAGVRRHCQTDQLACQSTS